MSTCKPQGVAEDSVKASISSLIRLRLNRYATVIGACTTGS